MNCEQSQPWKRLRTSDSQLPRHEHTIPAISEVVAFNKGEKIVIGGVVRTEVRWTSPLFTTLLLIDDRVNEATQRFCTTLIGLNQANIISLRP